MGGHDFVEGGIGSILAENIMVVPVYVQPAIF